MVDIPFMSKWDHLDSRNLDGVEVCSRSRRGIAAIEGLSKYGPGSEEASGSAILPTSSCKSDEEGCAMSLSAKSRDMTVTRRACRLEGDQTEATN